MHILPERLRVKLEDRGLTPSATDAENALWAIEQKKSWRRARYNAAAMTAVVIAVAGIVKMIRHPDMSTRMMLLTLVEGVVFGGFLFGMFLLQSSGDIASQRVTFILGRRMHREILDEPDLEPEDDSG
jgi:hypothetical protein